MRARARIGIVAACLASGCSGGGGDGGEGGGEGMPAFDAATDASASGGATEGIAATKAVLHTMIEEDPTLSLTAAPPENCMNMLARVTEQTATCTGVMVSCGGGTLSIDFGEACVIAEMSVTLSGAATATVTGGSGSPVTVAVSFDALTVETSSDSWTLGGTASVSTADLVAYALSADLMLDGRVLSFEGTAAASGSAEAGTLAVTVDGTGSLGGSSAPPPTGDGWTCTGGGAIEYTITGLHRAASSCYADAGTMRGTQSYTCSKTTTGRMPRMLMTSAAVEYTLAFSSTTATTGDVAVTTSVAFGTSAPVVTNDTIALPGDCP